MTEPEKQLEYLKLLDYEKIMLQTLIDSHRALTIGPRGEPYLRGGDLLIGFFRALSLTAESLDARYQTSLWAKKLGVK